MYSIGASFPPPLTVPRYKAEAEKARKTINDKLIARQDEAESQKAADALAKSDTRKMVGSVVNASRASGQSVTVKIIEEQPYPSSALQRIDAAEKAYDQLTEVNENLAQHLEAESQANITLKQEKEILIQEHKVMHQKLLAQQHEAENLKQALETERWNNRQEKQCTDFELRLQAMEQLLEADRVRFGTLKQSYTAENLEALKESVRMLAQMQKNFPLLVSELVEFEWKFEASDPVEQRVRVIMQRCKVIQQKMGALIEEKQGLTAKYEVMRQKLLAQQQKEENLKQALETERRDKLKEEKSTTELEFPAADQLMEAARGLSEAMSRQTEALMGAAESVEALKEMTARHRQFLESKVLLIRQKKLEALRQNGSANTTT